MTATSHFKVQLSGEHFTVEYEGKLRPVGFYTVRWVIAADAVEARALESNMLRRESKFRALRGDGVLSVSEVERCETAPGQPTTGYAFYFEDEGDDRSLQ